jgi:hypothetical protein
MIMTALAATKRLIAAASAVVACLLFAGCEEEPDVVDPPIQQEDTASDTDRPTDGDLDAQQDADNPGDGCSGSACSDSSGGDTCSGDGCEEMFSQCESPTEAGELTANNPLMVDGELPPDAPDELSTQCSSDDAGPERVIRFTSGADLQVTVDATTTGSLNVVTEVRQGWCRSSEAPAEGGTPACASSEQSFYAASGSTWYLIVERTAGIGGDFEVNISGEQACEYGGIGDSTCSGDAQKTCVRNEQDDIVSDESPCPTTCGGDACEGASCEHPITISNSRTVSGELSAFSADLNLSKSESSCPVNGVQADAAGPEVIFRVPSTTPGEVIGVQTSPDLETFYGFVTKDCPRSSPTVMCRKTWDSNGQFEVPQDGGGDYYIVIDRATVGGSSSFTFDFTRQAP